MLRSQTPPALLPTALACLLLLASCGGGSDDAPPTHASRYPALAAHADMDEEDFERLLLAAGRGTDITTETIKSLSVGSSINSAASTYNLRPIFDLGRLKEDGRLNVDTTRSQQVTALRITSNRNASTESSQFTLDASLSGSLGHYKAAAAFHHAEARRNTQSDGTVNVQLVSANTNNLVSILSSGFSGSENFTGYLTGTKLTDELLRGYVSTTESTPTGICGGKPYTTSVTVSRYKLSDTEPYANIQILSRMESVFADLRAQYDLCADASIQTVLVRQMTELRGKIQSAIADFYAFNGDSFVSRTASMNQAVGNGQLTFNTSDGNAEAQNGASLSGKYQTPAGGAGGSTTLQFYKQNGWAKALQNVQVSAEAKPAGVADTTAWVSSIHTMLKDQGSSLVPPMGSLPKDPGVKLPDPVGPHKDETDPPDVAFTSYDQWKKFQEDKKAAKDAAELARAQQRVEQEPLVVNENRLLLKAGEADAYQQLIAELDALKERAKAPQAPPQANDGNLVRFDKMYVSGFETLPYDAVIPQLRPNLDIPGLDKAIGSFPNLMEIMLVSEKLGRLDAYLAFLATLSVSNVTPQMSERYHQFFQKASSRAYDLVGLALSQGTDLAPAVLAGYKKAMLGTESTKTQSELYQNLQDIDYYNYVVGTLLDPAKGKAWTVAPGGYIPMRWKNDGSGGVELVTWTALSQERGGHRGKEGVVAIDFSNPNADPLKLYRDGMKTPQTPWYPVYVFNLSQAPSLVFVQHFGAYQAIYGPRWVTRPNDGDTPVTPSLVPKWQDYQPLGHSDMRTVMTHNSNDFLPFMRWQYSLYFPNASNDPPRLQKYKALLLEPPADYKESDGQTVHAAAHSAAVRDFKKSEYDRTARSDATYNAFRLPLKERWMRLTDDHGFKRDVTRSQDITMSDPWTNLLLLPLNTTTTGESLKQAFNYAPERAPLDIVTTTSLDLVNKLAVLQK
ncbi:hypothetical protein [Acidovorax sp. MR-S7]|uniref:hypothetical protein n=1 Tax=Acidovorax sp. MR-S7 TaxID=1268622 RepID=UPI00036E16D4|nr:hypothetical protein [Acidovorax sp. MR-S7]GAD20539.1 hypothetical protein AVS7_00300 [Acidovorax sp. MR-S7]